MKKSFVVLAIAPFVSAALLTGCGPTKCCISRVTFKGIMNDYREGEFLYRLSPKKSEKMP